MLQDKEKIEILLKEYDHRFDEIKFYIDKYNQQGNYLNILLTLIIGFITATISNWDKIDLFFKSVNSNHFLLPFILIFTLILTNYFYSLQNDSLTMVFLNGIRISYIEKKINEIAKEKLLMWDHSIIPSYHSDKNNLINNGWIKPTFMSWFWSILVMLCIYTLLATICYLFANHFFYIFIGLEIIFGLFHTIQARYLNTRGVGYMVNLVNLRSTNEIEHDGNETNEEKEQNENSNEIETEKNEPQKNSS
jgi:hypothetical protein